MNKKQVCEFAESVMALTGVAITMLDLLNKRFNDD
jgi:hypothetical protein